MPQVQLWPLVVSRIAVGAQAVTSAYGPMLGGFVVNPISAAAQGLATAESIFVNLYGTASTVPFGTTEEVPPGGTLPFPKDFSGMVSVNAASSGHQFAGVIFQQSPGFEPYTGTFPPIGPTTLTDIPDQLQMYLYQEYADDNDLQAFAQAFNQFVLQYVEFFANINLPVYTGPLITGYLLDWIGQGIYGIKRPSLPSGQTQNIGSLNTWAFNTIPLNEEIQVGPDNYYITTDDIYKRILTWYKWKGDGLWWNIRWLKRRVMRFLTGENGGPGATDTTYPVSVTFGVDGQLNINLLGTRRTAHGGAIIGVGLMNEFAFDEFDTTSVSQPVSPIAPIFKAAVQAGVLEFPFALSPIVNLN